MLQIKIIFYSISCIFMIFTCSKKKNKTKNENRMLAKSRSDFSSSLSTRKPIANSNLKSEENVVVHVENEISAVEKVEPSKGRAEKRIYKPVHKKPEAPRAKNGYNEELIAYQENALSDIFRTKDEPPVNSRETLANGKRSKPSRKSELKATQSLD